MRWMIDYRHALQVAIGTDAALIGLHLLMSRKEGSDSALRMLLTVWVFAAMPSILCVTSIMSAKGRQSKIAMNLLLSVLVWVGLTVAMLAGLAVAY